MATNLLWRLMFYPLSGIMCKGICGWVLIGILDWHSSNTLSSPQLTLDWHLREQHVDQYIWLSELTPGWLCVNWVSAEYWLRCRSSVNWDFDCVSIEGQWRVSISTLLQMPSEHMNHQVVCTVKAYHRFHNMKHLQLEVRGNFCFLRWIITNEWHDINVRRNYMLIKWVHFLQVAGYMVLYQGATNTHYQKKLGEWVCEQLCQSDMLRWPSLTAVTCILKTHLNKYCTEVQCMHILLQTKIPGTLACHECQECNGLCLEVVHVHVVTWYFSKILKRFQGLTTNKPNSVRSSEGF